MPDILSGRLARAALLRGLGLGVFGIPGLCLFLGLALAAWAWMEGEDTRARLAAAVPQITVPLDWDALAIPETSVKPAQALASPPVAPSALAPETSSVPSSSPVPVALPSAPLDGLFETAAVGRLPIVRLTDGMTPFAAYRRPFDLQTADPSGARGMVSILVRDMGLSDSATATAIKTFPPDVTFALSPYAAQPDFWQEQTRADGHEIWIGLPTALPGSDPGPLALTGQVGLEENTQRLLANLSRTVGYAGVVLLDSCGSLGSPSQGETLRAPIFTRGLGLADLSPRPCEALGLAATKASIPYASGAERLDRDLRPQAIRDALDLLEARAVAKGSAIGVLSPSPLAYQEVSSWIETLPRKNIVLAPLSARMPLPEKAAAP